MHKLLRSIFILCLATSAYIVTSLAQIPFTRHPVAVNFDRASGLYTHDVDRDGNEDIIGAAINSNEVAWWRNDGSDTVGWIKQTIANDFGGAIYVHAADMDHDSDIDVLATAANAGEVALFRNDGGDPINWTKHTIETGYNDAHGIFASDIDGDGDNDIIATSAELNQISWWENVDGDGSTWVQHLITNNFTYTQSVFPADIDVDGDIDIVAAAGKDNQVAWWRNESGFGLSWTKFVIDNNFSWAHNIKVADIDGDGYLDVAGAAYSGSQIAWWKNCGGDPINWTKQLVNYTYFGALSVCVADMDNDGRNDILGTSTTLGNISWWRNNGGNPIEWQKYTIDTMARVWPLAVADFNNDSELDVVAGSSSMNKIELWKNGFLHADFSVSRTSGLDPLTVRFVDTSIPSKGIIDWAWDLNNDAIIESHDQNPTWQYNEPGTYTITLIVSSPYFSDTLRRENYIKVLEPQRVTLDVAYNAGWNLVSIPIIADNYCLDTLFSSSSSSAFEYIDNYQLKDSLESTKGYWLKFPVSQQIPITGLQTEFSVIAVKEGWNLIGSISEPLLTSTIVSEPAGIGTSQFFTYNGHYEASDTIQSGRGYWVRVNQSGALILASAITTPARLAKSLIRITATSETPPPPPEGNASPSGIPQKYCLEQNYPNPFNPTTSISFGLPEASYVTLKIFNILGTEIETLTQQTYNPGFYTLSWNAKNVGSGVYFYQLVGQAIGKGATPSFSETRRLLLIK